MGEIIGTVFPAWEPGNLIFAISCLFSLLSVSVWPLFVAELMHCIVFHHEVDRKGRDARAGNISNLSASFSRGRNPVESFLSQDTKFVTSTNLDCKLKN